MMDVSLSRKQPRLFSTEVNAETPTVEAAQSRGLTQCVHSGSALHFERESNKDCLFGNSINESFRLDTLVVRKIWSPSSTYNRRRVWCETYLSTVWASRWLGYESQNGNFSPGLYSMQTFCPATGPMLQFVHDSTW